MGEVDKLHSAYDRLLKKHTNVEHDLNRISSSVKKKYGIFNVGNAKRRIKKLEEELEEVESERGKLKREVEGIISKMEG